MCPLGIVYKNRRGSTIMDWKGIAQERIRQTHQLRQGRHSGGETMAGGSPQKK